jgi:hypothetical protein
VVWRFTKLLSKRLNCASALLALPKVLLFILSCWIATLPRQIEKAKGAEVLVGSCHNDGADVR